MHACADSLLAQHQRRLTAPSPDACRRTSTGDGGAGGGAHSSLVVAAAAAAAASKCRQMKSVETASQQDARTSRASFSSAASSASCSSAAAAIAAATGASINSSSSHSSRRSSASSSSSSSSSACSCLCAVRNRAPDPSSAQLALIRQTTFAERSGDDDNSSSSSSSSSNKNKSNPVDISRYCSARRRTSHDSAGAVAPILVAQCKCRAFPARAKCASSSLSASSIGGRQQQQQLAEETDEEIVIMSTPLHSYAASSALCTCVNQSRAPAETNCRCAQSASANNDGALTEHANSPLIINSASGRAHKQQCTACGHNLRAADHHFQNHSQIGAANNLHKPCKLCQQERQQAAAAAAASNQLCRVARRATAVCCSAAAESAPTSARGNDDGGGRANADDGCESVTQQTQNQYSPMQRSSRSGGGGSEAAKACRCKHALGETTATNLLPPGSKLALVERAGSECSTRSPSVASSTASSGAAASMCSGRESLSLSSSSGVVVSSCTASSILFSAKSHNSRDSRQLNSDDDYDDDNCGDNCGDICDYGSTIGSSDECGSRDRVIGRGKQRRQVRDANNNTDGNGDADDAYSQQSSQPHAPPPPPPPPPLPQLPPATFKPSTSNSNVAVRAPSDAPLATGAPVQRRASSNVRLTPPAAPGPLKSSAAGAKLPLAAALSFHAPPLAAFIPPQFSAPPKDGANIKPSEYLRRMSSAAGAPTKQTESDERDENNSSTALAEGQAREFDENECFVPKRVFARNTSAAARSSSNKFKQMANSSARLRALGTLNRSQSTLALSELNEQTNRQTSSDNDETTSVYSAASSATSTSTSASSSSAPAAAKSAAGCCTQQQQQKGAISALAAHNNLLGAVRNFDRSKLNKCAPTLNSTQRYYNSTTSSDTRETQVAANKPPFALFGAESQSSPAATNSYAATKRDLIAELKKSKDLDGIKRMRDTHSSKGELSKTIAATMPAFKPEDFLDKVAQVEPEAPLWKRQMLAKKAAERARKEHEERTRIEFEERRQSQVPRWKRDMLAKKAEKNQNHAVNGRKKESASNPDRTGDL